MHLSPSGSYMLDSRAGVPIRQPITANREEFIKMIYVAKSQSHCQTTAD
jgi:hypothetical protein